MDKEFEEGKRLLIEGIQEFIKLYEPVVKLTRGMKILGIKDLLGEGKEFSDSAENWDVMKFVINSLTSDVSQAKNREEVQIAVEKNQEFFKRLF